MSLIFISYRRKDSSGHAGRIHDHLRSALKVDERDVYLDVESMAPGSNWLQEVQENLSRCAVLLVLIGERWQPERLSDPNDYVRSELLASEQLGIALIPVLVDGAELPAESQLPAELRFLRSRQSHRLDSESNRAYLHDLEALVDAVRHAIAPAGLERLLSRRTLLEIVRSDGSSVDGGAGYLIFGNGVLMGGVTKGGSASLVTLPGRLVMHVEFSTHWRTPKAGGVNRGRSPQWHGILESGKYRFECGVDASWLNWLPFLDVDLYLKLVRHEPWPRNVHQLDPRDRELVSQAELPDP